MIEFVDKKEDPLFIRFKVINENTQKVVLLLWQDALTGSCIYSDLVTINNNYIYFSEINKGFSFFKNDILFKIIDLNQKVLFTYCYKKLPFEKPGSVLYISQNTNTGYGYASRNYIYQLITNGYKVDWKTDELGPCNFTPTTYEEKMVHNTIITSIKNEYDYVIIHHVPDTWNDFLSRYNNKFNYKKIYGLTTWETTKVNKKWVELINESKIDEIIVHSKFNVEIFKNSGINKPINCWYIDTFPFADDQILNNLDISNKCYIYKNNNFSNDLNEIKRSLKTKTLYYNISQYNERKNIDQLIRVFCKKFRSTDKVCLFIKTFFKEYTDSQKEYLKYRFHTLLSNYKDLPDIVFCFEDLNDFEIQSIHKIGDVYFTLNRGEGFGLCTYTAKKFGNKVICGRFGSEKEFIDDNDVLLNYQLCSTFNMYHYHDWYDDGEQQWASYDDDYVLSKLQYYPKK